MILTFDPQLYVSEVIFVGCGGTGAQWANGMARIIRMMKDTGKKIPHIKFIDPDHFEVKNVGRQLVQDATIGENKAVELARRFNMALGLNIEAIPEAFDPQKHVAQHSRTILCGAVDNWQARRTMAEVSGAVWIDVGNSRYSGQAVIGTCSDIEMIQAHLQAIRTDDTALRWLPNAAAVFPELLNPDPEEEHLTQTLSCAELLERSLQSATINGFMANIATEYLRKVLYREPIKSWITHVDTTTLSMTSAPITVANFLDKTPDLEKCHVSKSLIETVA
jgi:PRTRC genetic system ThiF family protein